MPFGVSRARFPGLSDVQGKKGPACPEVTGSEHQLGRKGMSYSLLGHDPLQEHRSHPQVQHLVVFPMPGCAYQPVVLLIMARKP